MKTPFIIYCRAVGIYALLTLPLMVNPFIYFFSLTIVLAYGWFACIIFLLLYLLLNTFLFDFVLKLLLLFISVAIAVGFAYYMAGMLSIGSEIRQAEFFIFPFAAVIAGWISLCYSREKIRNSCYAGENDTAV
ncbi:MAG TPA: hypothetical protein VFI06_07490 [Chitinophagaceae bacterium]|nr:hypothetical protein [Chitinophagaceae bacterium]